MCGILYISGFLIWEDIYCNNINTMFLVLYQFFSPSLFRHKYNWIHTFRLSVSWRMSIAIWVSKYPHKIGHSGHPEFPDLLLFSFSGNLRLTLIVMDSVSCVSLNILRKTESSTWPLTDLFFFFIVWGLCIQIYTNVYKCILNMDAAVIVW